MANVGCNRTRRGFCLSCHHKRVSNVAVRNAKQAKARIAAIPQPDPPSMHSWFADSLATAPPLAAMGCLLHPFCNYFTY